MQVSQCNQHYYKRTTKVSNIVLHNWFYGDFDFTQLPHHLSSLRETQQLHGWKDLSMTQLVVNRLNVFGAVMKTVYSATMELCLKELFSCGIMVHLWVLLHTE